MVTRKIKKSAKELHCVSCSPLSFQTYRIVDIRLKNSTIGEFNVSCQNHSLQVDLLFLYFQISMLRDVISNVLLPLGVSYVNFSKICFILLTKLHFNSSIFFLFTKLHVMGAQQLTTE